MRQIHEAAQTVSLGIPNVILAGAPKCGTSSLFNWLTAHPQVVGSSPKETFYFIDPTNPLLNPKANYHRHGLAGYQQFFPDWVDRPTLDAANQPAIWLEATTHYLYQDTALRFFAACQPQPCLIFVLRKPSDRIFSSFSYTQHNLARLDQRLSFGDFTELLLAGQLDRIQERFYSEQSFFVLKRDLAYSQYYDWLSRWAEYFPASRLKILLFEDLKANPQAMLDRLARELGIDPAFYQGFDYQQQNQTIAIQHAAIHRQLRRVVPLLPNNRLKSLLKSIYFNVQAQSHSPQLAGSQAMQQLDAYFAPYNQKLAHAFGLSLDPWN